MKIHSAGSAIEWSMVSLGHKGGRQRVGVGMGKPASGENRGVHCIRAALCPWSSSEGLLRALIQTLDSKSQAPAQKLKGEDGWRLLLLGDGCPLRMLRARKPRREACGRSPVRWAL